MKLKELIKELEIPPTFKRVEKRTRKKVNEIIWKRTIRYINAYKGASYEDLTRRLGELDREWDTERVLELNDAVLITAVSAIGLATRKPGWFILSGIIGIFLASHAMEGWSLAQEVIRALGVRTPSEINLERTAIKYLRGDFITRTDVPLRIYELAALD